MIARLAFSGLLALLSTCPVSAATIMVTTDIDEASGTINGNCTLREAIDAANNNSVRDGCAAGDDADQIVFGGDYTITLSFGELNVNTELSINEPTAAQPVPRAIILDGAQSTRLFRLASAASALTLSSMTLRNGNTSGGGGAIFMSADGDLAANFVTFEDNQANGDGGAISSNGDVSLTGAVFTGNQANGSGGAVSTTGQNLILSGGFFGNLPGSGNSAGQNGGALHIRATGATDQMLVDGVFFGFNAADGSGAERGGGAIWADTSNAATFVFQISNAVFLNNEATAGAGGAILATANSRIAYADPLLPFAGGISRSHFEGNNAAGSGDPNGAGGAIYNRGTMTVMASSFVNNSSDQGAGGAIAHNTPTDRELVIANTTFSANSAGSDGGAIASMSASNGTVILINTTIDGNQAMNSGGGLHNQNNTASEFAVGNSVLSNNMAASIPANCAGQPFQNDDGNLQFGADDCGNVPSGDPQLDAPVPDPASPNPLVWTMQPMALSAVHSSGKAELCNAAPVNRLDARNAARPQGGAVCDAGAYESDGKYVPPGDIIFVDNFADPQCSDDDFGEPDFEASARNIGVTNDCPSGPVLSAAGLLGTTEDIDFFRFTVNDNSGCSERTTLRIESSRDLQTCAYYACASGTASVNCLRGSSFTTSSLGLPGCCNTGPALSPNVSCSGADDTMQIVVQVHEPVIACAAYTLQVD